MTADVSARLAWGEDAATIAVLQAAAWREMYAPLLGSEVVDDLPVAEFENKWARSLHDPGDARRRVLVALEGPHVRGFAVTQPASDPDADPIDDAELTELTIGATYRRQGHGSRLLQACIDTMRADGFQRALWWLPTTADDLRHWAMESGWAPDGAHRELETESGARLKQIRLHVDVREG